MINELDLIYEKVAEKLYQEFSGAGAIGGVSLPLGAKANKHLNKKDFDVYKNNENDFKDIYEDLDEDLDEIK